MDVPCNAAARYVRVRSADSSQLVICELFVSQGDQPYTGTEVRGGGEGIGVPTVLVLKA